MAARHRHHDGVHQEDTSDESGSDGSDEVSDVLSAAKELGTTIDQYVKINETLKARPDIGAFRALVSIATMDLYESLLLIIFFQRYFQYEICVILNIVTLDNMQDLNLTESERDNMIQLGYNSVEHALNKDYMPYLVIK